MSNITRIKNTKLVLICSKHFSIPISSYVIFFYYTIAVEYYKAIVKMETESINIYTTYMEEIQITNT